MKRRLATIALLLPITTALAHNEWWYLDDYPWIYSTEDGWNYATTVDDSDVVALQAGTESFQVLGGFQSTGGWWYAEEYPWVWSPDTGWNFLSTTDGELYLLSPDDGAVRLAGVEHDSATGISPYADSYQIENQEYGTMVTVTVANGTRTITSNSLPNHGTDGLNSPNAVSAQNLNYSLPTNPSENGSATSYNIPQPFGIAYNGIVIDPFAAEWYNDDRNSGWQLAALNNPLGFDQNNAHVQPDGTYHYHGAPTALIEQNPSQAQLIGWAGDGFPIYGPYGTQYNDTGDTTSTPVELKSSYILKSGTRPSGPGGNYDGTYVEDYEYVAGSGDLDEANGRFGPTPEFPNGTYHYVITNQYPYIPIAFRGNIAESFVKAGGAVGAVGGPPR